MGKKILTREENLEIYKKSRLAGQVDCNNLPLSLLVEVTSRCNLSCWMCNIHHDKRSGIDIDERLLKMSYILSEVASIVHSYGLGEALIHKDIIEIVDNYKSRGAFVSIVTNGMLLNERISRGFVDKGLDSLAISIDSANKELFKKIRRGADLEVIKRNVKGLNEIKKSENKQKPILAMNVVVQRSNFYELSDIVDIAKELGVSFITFSPITVHEHISEIRNEAMTSEIKGWQKVLKDCLERARNYNISINADRLNCILRDLKPEEFYKNKIPCPEPFRFLGIRANGDVYPCCNWDVNEPLGNIIKEVNIFDELLKLWKDGKWKALREDVIKGSYPWICKKCMNNFTRPFYDEFCPI